MSSTGHLVPFRHPLHLHLGRICRAVFRCSQARGGQVRADFGDVPVDGLAANPELLSRLGGAELHQQATHTSEPLGHTGQHGPHIQVKFAPALFVRLTGTRIVHDRLVAQYDVLEADRAITRPAPTRAPDPRGVLDKLAQHAVDEGLALGLSWIEPLKSRKQFDHHVLAIVFLLVFRQIELDGQPPDAEGDPLQGVVVDQLLRRELIALLLGARGRGFAVVGDRPPVEGRVLHESRLSRAVGTKKAR